MLNETIISASQMLTPLWSEQIVKYFFLDYRYCTVLTLIFNGISNMLSFSDTTATFLIGLISLGFFLRKFAFKLSFSFFKNKNKTILFVTSFNAEKETIHNCDNNYIEKFLYENQNYFKNVPKWQTSRLLKMGRSECNYTIDEYSVFLQDGVFYVVMENDISFKITVETNNNEKKISSRNFSITFDKGDENTLFHFMTLKEKTKTQINRIIYSYPLGIMLGTLENCDVKMGKLSTFFGYYNPKLDMIIEWIDSLQSPSKNHQPRQFSILCHGKSGTGKTAIVKRIAEYTGRNIVLVNLFEVKKKKNLMELFYSAEGDTGHGNGVHYSSKINQTIFFIDEFDKVVKKLKILLKENKKKKEENLCLLLKTADKENANEILNKPEQDANVFDWDIDDLLEIFCGSYIPDKRMIVVACNDLEIITQEYPYLVRPGRLTPVKFDHGDRSLFRRIIKDYVNIELSESDIDEDYVFNQSHLIEFLNYKIEISREEILENLEMFRVFDY